jgi:hypothetical protein
MIILFYNLSALSLLISDTTSTRIAIKRFRTIIDEIATKVMKNGHELGYTSKIGNITVSQEDKVMICTNVNRASPI